MHRMLGAVGARCADTSARVKCRNIKRRFLNTTVAIWLYLEEIFDVFYAFLKKQLYLIIL